MPIDERMKPYKTTQEEQALRWAYGQGEITHEEFDRQYAELIKRGVIIRDGRKVVTDGI